MGVSGQRHTLPPYPRVIHGTHCIAGRVGLRAGLDWCRKYHYVQHTFSVNDIIFLHHLVVVVVVIIIIIIILTIQNVAHD